MAVVLITSLLDFALRLECVGEEVGEASELSHNMGAMGTSSPHPSSKAKDREDTGVMGT